MFSQLIPFLKDKVIVLASGSPRRKEILSKLGLHFDIISSNFAEDLDKKQYVGQPYKYALDNARFKGFDVLETLKSALNIPELIISADTVVYFQDKIYEKPKDADDAFSILSSFSGRQHEVYTGVVLFRCSQDQEPIRREFFERTVVQFGELNEQLIKAYIATKEPMDKAGGYGIQDLGAALIEKIDGDYCNVQGLPYFRLTQELIKLYCN